MDKPVLTSTAINSVGRGWTGGIAAGDPGSQRVIITSRVTDGIKPAIGRLHELKLTADHAEELLESLPRLIEDVRFHERRGNGQN